MSDSHPVVFRFGGAEHHLTLDEASAAVGRLQAGIAGAMQAQERATRETRERLEAIARQKAEAEAPPVDRDALCTVGEALAPGVPNEEDRGDGQQKGYVVLCEEERRKGFVRPVRRSYRHVGVRPKYPLRDLTPEEIERYDRFGYVKFETYPESMRPRTGKFWTERELSSGCGTVTTMGRALAETYARDPAFYGSTFCCGCGAHYRVGADGEFVWDGTEERVGT